MRSALAFAFAAAARAYAKRRANRACARLGLAAVFTDESYVAARTQASILMTFRCGPAT